MESYKINEDRDEYDYHGSKTIATYTYWLLVDSVGNAFIQRSSEDDSSVFYCRMPEVIGTSEEKATAINDFWEHPETKTYSYLFQC